MKLNEVRKPTLEFFAQHFPDMPEYVLQDFIYKNYRDYPEEIEELKAKLEGVKWKHEVLTVTLDVFDPYTQQCIKQRAGGTQNPFQVPDDEARHAKQQELLAKGPSQEPIIVMESPDGYELFEGWHRTIQSLQKWPKGYKQNTWIGYR